MSATRTGAAFETSSTAAITTSIPSGPDAPAAARAFVRANAVLDAMRMTEAGLLVSEAVTNVLVHSPSADSIDLAIEVRQAGLRLAVVHPHPTPLGQVAPGLGFSLMDTLAESWGHDHDGGRLRVWFVVRTPGSVAVPPDMSDEELLAGLADHPPFAGELIRRHSDLATSIARRYRGKGIPEDDLEQVAHMALLKAIQRFNPDLGDIRPYAAVTISGEMKKLLRDSGWSVRVPRSVQEAALEVARASEILSQRLRRPPEPGELADHLGMGVEEVTQAMAARMAYTSRSLERPTERTGMTLAERLGAADTGMAATDDRLVLEEAISSLPPRQRHILDLRFNHDMTQSEIAALIGISQMHVSRLLSKSMQSLRERLHSPE